jgi:hypothetical protein
VTLLAAAAEHQELGRATQAVLETAVSEVLGFQAILMVHLLQGLVAAAVLYGLGLGLVVMEALEVEVEVLIAQITALVDQ